jgi:uncharacterized membrane protein
MSDNTLHDNTDLALIVTLVLSFDLLIMLAPDSTELRLLLGLPVLLFAPGYVVVTVLFPARSSVRTTERPRAAAGGDSHTRSATISTPARIGLATAASIAIVGGLAVLVNATPMGIQMFPVLAGITVVTTAGAVIAGYRRRALPVHRRYTPSLPIGALSRAVRLRFSITVLLGLVFVASLLGATAVVGTTDIAQGVASERYTEFSVTTVNESGAYVTAGYTDAISDDDPLYFQITNKEGSDVKYTVVLIRETVDRRGDNVVVTDTTEQAQRRVTVAAGEKERLAYDPEPTETDSPQRLAAVLYRTGTANSSSESTPYRSLQVWYVEDPTETLGIENDSSAS